MSTNLTTNAIRGVEPKQTRIRHVFGGKPTVEDGAPTMRWTEIPGATKGDYTATGRYFTYRLVKHDWDRNYSLSMSARPAVEFMALTFAVGGPWTTFDAAKRGATEFVSHVEQSTVEVPIAHIVERAEAVSPLEGEPSVWLINQGGQDAMFKRTRQGLWLMHTGNVLTFTPAPGGPRVGRVAVELRAYDRRIGRVGASWSIPGVPFQHKDAA